MGEIMDVRIDERFELENMQLYMLQISKNMHLLIEHLDNLVALLDSVSIPENDQ